MQRIDSATRVIDLHGAGKDGWTAGNPLTGTPATSQTAAMWNALQEEISGLIEAWLGALNPASYIQLRLAIEAKITAMIAATGVTGKVAKAGDTMTGILDNINSGNVNGSGSNHIRMLRGNGSGRTGNVGVIANGANGVSALYLMIAEAVGTGVASLILQNDGRVTIGANGTGPTDVVTVQQLAAATTVPDATAAVKGKVALAIASEIDTGTDPNKAVTSAALAGSKRAARAWANVLGAGSATLSKGHNIASVSRISAGLYQFVFTNNMPDADYAAFVSVVDYPGVQKIVAGRTVSTFSVQNQHVNLTATDVPGLSVLVFD